jgi:uncharacterized lipoprotein YddW (UPF0748 family)
VAFWAASLAAVSPQAARAVAVEAASAQAASAAAVEPGPAGSQPASAAAKPTSPQPAPAAAKPTSPQPAAPRLYLWVVRGALEDTLAFARLAEDAAAAGFTDLLVQVRGRGEAHYRSATEPAPAGLDRSGRTRPGSEPSERSLRFDPLAAALRAAGARGLRVHLWMNVFLAADWEESRPTHVWTKHPDWRLRLEDGHFPGDLTAAGRRERRLEGSFLNPARADVRRYLAGLVAEALGRYPAAGVHLDYIRYPWAESGCDRATLAAFLEDRAGTWDRYARMADTSDAWHVWRAEQVSRTVEAIAAAARAARPGCEISAAVIPEPGEAAFTCQQDWRLWIERGWCDRVFQMAYRSTVERIEEDRRVGLACDPSGARVALGVGLHRLDVGHFGQLLERLSGERVAALAVFSDVQLQEAPEIGPLLKAFREGR